MPSVIRSDDPRAIYMRMWREKHPEWDVANAKRHNKSYYMYKAIVHERLGNVCCKCGFSDVRALQIDHINGDAKAERVRTSGYGYRWLQRLAENPDIHLRYQLLCANCNWIKRHENKELAYGRNKATKVAH